MQSYILCLIFVLPIKRGVKLYRGVEQLVARRAHNPKVVGSSPTPATTESSAICRAFFLIKSFMFTVYVLYSKSYDKIYIGYTSNLIQRFYSHNELSQKGWTRKFRPWLVIYTEVFETKSEAMKRESELKTGAGRRYIRKDILLK